MNRREFLDNAVKIATKAGIVCYCAGSLLAENIEDSVEKSTKEHRRVGVDQSKRSDSPKQLEKFRYWFLVDTTKCIGCGSCVRACRRENNVDKNWYRTWVERYTVDNSGNVEVDSPHGGEFGFKELEMDEEPLKAFFVPKLCNQCSDTPCVQVCPVGATFMTPDGFILVDRKRCMGCGYCVQSCPYGARYFDPKDHSVDKCTWCYHRIKKGYQPACVEACPVKARVFGDRHDPDNPIEELRKKYRIGVLKPELGTNPKTQYIGLTKEVR